MPNHKHHDLIIAWAKGAAIQRLAWNCQEWVDDSSPSWHPDNKYRLAPVKKYQWLMYKKDINHYFMTGHYYSSVEEVLRDYKGYKDTVPIKPIPETEKVC